MKRIYRNKSSVEYAKSNAINKNERLKQQTRINIRNLFNAQMAILFYKLSFAQGMLQFSFEVLLQISV